MNIQSIIIQSQCYPFLTDIGPKIAIVSPQNAQMRERSNYSGNLRVNIGQERKITEIR